MNKVYRAFVPSEERKAVIKNSEVIKAGDWITDEGTGVANIDAKTESVLGLCLRIETADGRSLESPSVTAADYDGTWTASTKSYTAAATNADAGGKGIVAVYIPAKEDTEFLAQVDDTKGTTAGPRGYYFAIKTTDSSYLDESDATTTEAGMQFYCTDAYRSDDTTHIVVKAQNRHTTTKATS